MARKKWTNAEVDEWWDRAINTDLESYTEIKNDHEFTCFKLRFGMYNKRRKYIPERVRSIMVNGLRNFCSIKDNYQDQYQYIDAFGFSCAIQDILSAKMAYDRIEDKTQLKDTKIPAYFFKWFNKQSRLENSVSDQQVN